MVHSEILPTTDMYGNPTNPQMQKQMSRKEIKRINARVEKWRSMVPKLAVMMERRDSEIKERARKVYCS
jgi:hypothetical protein